MSELACSAAAERNKQAILEILRQVLPAQGSALEIASGTGQHVACFAAGLPHWTWQPTDYQASALPVIAARIAQQKLANVRAPRQLDVTNARWFADAEPAPRFDLIFCANMLHISPWATCAGLMQGSARHLSTDGVLITYGPYLEDEFATANSNLEFDRSLRAQNPAWGIRRRLEVEAQAAKAGRHLSARHAMPANNLLLVWRVAPDLN
jgi:hypothetical protein